VTVGVEHVTEEDAIVVVDLAHPVVEREDGVALPAEIIGAVAAENSCAGTTPIAIRIIS
jgi:hypothetical protein